ncbi:43792_t:CDS:2, partial [Gigaspora margarita]
LSSASDLWLNIYLDALFKSIYDGTLARISTELEIVEIEAEYIQVSIGELALDLKSLELRLDTLDVRVNIGMKLFWIHWGFENFGL